MKKTLLCCVLSLCLLLAGCSSGPKLDKNNPVTIQLWNYYIGEQKKAFDSLVDEFNLTVGHDQGIILEAVSKADINSMNKQITDSLNNEPGAEPLPDLFFAYADVAYVLAQQDLLVDYTQYVDEETLAEYQPGFLDEGKLYGDDRVYILPAAKSTEVLVVNKTYFDEFTAAYNATGPEATLSMDNFATWEGIATAAEAYYQWTAEHNPIDQGGRALFGIDSLPNYLFSSHKQLGYDLVYAQDGKGVLDFTTGVFPKVWDNFYGPTIKGHFASYGRFRSDDLKTGDILAYLGSNTSAAYLGGEVVGEDGVGIPVEIEALPMPVFADGTPVAIQQGAGIAVMKSEPLQELAATVFATWFSEAERNMEFATQSAYLPVRNSAIHSLLPNYENLSADAPPLSKVLKVSLEQIDSGYMMYTPPIFDESYNVRTTLESTLREAVEENRASVLREISSGEDYDAVVSEYTADKYRQAYIDRCAALLKGYEVEIKQ